MLTRFAVVALVRDIQILYLYQHTRMNYYSPTKIHQWVSEPCTVFTVRCQPMIYWLL